MEFTHCAATLTPMPPDSKPSGAGGAVIYSSRGVALVIGDGPETLDPARVLAAKLQVVVFAPGIDASIELPRNLTAIGGRIVAIEGYLGCFRAHAAISGGGQRDIAPFSPNTDGCFDLVLDLGQSPLVSREVLPLGYFAPRDAASADTAIDVMQTLVGKFRKPRYFNYTASLCAHGAKGLVGCTRCLDVCDAGAIRSTGDTVTVDPHLCQGCATCTLACPTGALSYAVPSRGSLLQRVEALITTAREEGINHPIIVVYGPKTSPIIGTVSPEARTLEVEATLAFGDEMWLATLAAGARAVVLVDDPTWSSHARALLKQRISETAVLLAATGHDPASVALVRSAEVESTISTMKDTGVLPHLSATLANSEKRTAALAAIDALAHGAGMADIVPLPPTAFYGEVVVNREACTLCFACTNLCPTSALVADDTAQPALNFIEADCVQCGLCEVGCPEHAISLKPRLVLARDARHAARTLSADELFRCTECATPFISKKVLMRSVERLKDHPVLQDGGLERLMLCMECRARASMQVSNSGIGV